MQSGLLQVKVPLERNGTARSDTWRYPNQTADKISGSIGDIIVRFGSMRGPIPAPVFSVLRRSIDAEMHFIVLTYLTIH